MRFVRRDFLKMYGAGAALASSGVGVNAATSSKGELRVATRQYNDDYSGPYLNRVAFPIGGIGAGMLCLEGTGAFSHFSLRNKPEVFNEPCTFAAISVPGLKNGAKILEGPVPTWKIFGISGAGNGTRGSSFGFPRFQEATFLPQFPFASVRLADSDLPL